MTATNRFQESRDRGLAYLLEQQGPRGEFPANAPEVADYYKPLTAFQVCGRNDAAHRLCRWIRKYGFSAEGDFGPRSPSAGADSYAYAYFNSWLVLGAHRLGQFDLSFKGMEFILSFYDSESGGFYSSQGERGGDTEQDLMVVSMCGLAALQTGHLDVAQNAGGWLRSLLEAQPDFPNRLYTVYSQTDGLQTTPPPGEELRYLVIGDATEDQAFFNPGIAAAFLTRLFQVTAEEPWLETAKEYMRFAENASDFLFRLVRAGKVGWAAALLYTATGETKYRDIAVRIGDNLIDLQSPSGWWSGVGSTTPSHDSTAERVIWMDEISQAV